MKRIGHLHEKMLNRSLIRWVIVEGSKGKRKRRDVKRVMADVDGYVEKVYRLVKDRSYKPTQPKDVQIIDKSSGKERTIGVVPYYPDGIMHRLVTEVIKPALMRGMYAHSCASIPGRGNAHAIKYVKKSLRDRKYSKYCAKLDIRHYYPSLRPERIVEALRRKIKDEKILSLIGKIISSGNQEGLTIGFYINQWLANFYLEALDHKIIAFDGVSYYVRNMDDMVLIGGNKKKLHKAVRMIDSELEKLGLKLKDNWQVFRVDSRGIDFVGYRFYRTHVLLRRRNFRKLRRHCLRVKKRVENDEPVSYHSASGLLSRIGQLQHCSGYNIKKKYVDCIGIGFLKSVVRRYARKMNHEKCYCG